MDETGSTNEDLLEEAAGGAPEGLVLVAKHQTSGRGRQGRAWLDSPDSSLLVSWLLRPNKENLGLLPLLTGLSVVLALESVMPPQADSVSIALKWPNDVLSIATPERPERKLAGILAEASTKGSDLAVVIGLGINLKFGSGVPDEVSDIAIDLASVFDAPIPSPLEMLELILEQVEDLLQALDSLGPKHILQRYRDRCITLGRLVRMDTPSGIVEGRAVDISVDGGLVIETDSGQVTVIAGDTHHLS